MSLPPGTPELAVLDLLVTVGETGSLGRAAQRAGISQPAASMRLSGLERRLKLTLLERSPTGSRLTPAGAAVVDWAKPVLDAARELVSGVAALQADRSGKLRIAASMTIADHLVPAWLVSLHLHVGDAAVALRMGNSTQVAQMVSDREADLGFVEGPAAPPGLTCRVIGGDELLVIVAPDHPWARRRGPLPVATLVATPLLLREQGSGTRDAAWEYLCKFGDPAPPAAELGSTTAIKTAVATGEAPAIVSALAVQAELAGHRLVAVPLDLAEPWCRRFRAVWRPDRPPSGPAAVLLKLISGDRRPRSRSVQPMSTGSPASRHAEVPPIRSVNLVNP